MTSPRKSLRMGSLESPPADRVWQVVSQFKAGSTQGTCWATDWASAPALSTLLVFSCVFSPTGQSSEYLGTHWTQGEEGGDSGTGT